MPHWIYVLDVSCEGLVAQITLNGIDVFTEWEGRARQSQSKLNPYVVEGGNVLELSLTPMTDDEGRPLVVAHAFSVRLIVAEHGREPGPQSQVAAFRWDESTMPVATGELTSVWSRQFNVLPERAFGRWIWQDAPDVAPSAADAAALVDLARTVHTALVARDADELVALTAVKSAELARALDVQIAEIDEGQRELYAELFASPSWRVAPFDASQLGAVPRADGRLVRVTDQSGGPALVGTTDDRPFAFSFLATRYEGRWTIVR